jgi:hypothetical protein
MRIFSVIALQAALAFVTLTLKSMVTDAKTSGIIGERDILSGGLERRFVEKMSESTMTIENTDQQSIELGVEDWGPVQIAMTMSRYPEKAARSDDPRLCKIINENTHLSIDTIPAVSEGIKFEVAHMAYMDDVLFCLKKNSRKLHGIKLGFKNDSVSTKLHALIPTWTLDITEMLVSETEKAWMVQDPIHNQMLLFFGDKVVFVNMTSIANQTDKAPSYTITGFTFTSEGDVKFLDAHKDNLLVLSTNTLELYTLAKGRIGTIPRTLIDDQFHQIQSSTPKLRDFEINAGRIEIIDSMSITEQSDQNLYNDSLFNIAVSAWSREHWTLSPRLTADLLFVAEESKVYIYDFKEMISGGNVSDALLPHYMDISNVISIRRYHESIYLLKASTNDENSPALQVIEVFLLSNSVSKWRAATSDDDLYKINRIFMADFDIDEIYVDDLHLYMIGEKKNALAYRGTPSEYIDADLDLKLTIVKGTPGKTLSHIQKILVNGTNVVIGMRDQTPTQFNPNPQKIKLQCPSKISNFDFGDYEIDINVTTVSCPQKNSVLTVSFNLTEDLQRACVLQKRIRIKYGGTTDISKLTNKGGNEGRKGLPLWIWVIMTTLILVVLILIIMIVRGSSVDKKKQEEMELRTQGTISDRRVGQFSRSLSRQNLTGKINPEDVIISDRKPEDGQSNRFTISPRGDDVEIDSPGIGKMQSQLKRKGTRDDFNISVQ